MEEYKYNEFQKTSNKIMKTPQKSQPLIKPQNESVTLNKSRIKQRQNIQLTQLMIPKYLILRVIK